MNAFSSDVMTQEPIADKLPLKRTPGMPYDEWATIVAVRSARSHRPINFKQYMKWLDYYMNLIFTRG